MSGYLLHVHTYHIVHRILGTKQKCKCKCRYSVHEPYEDCYSELLKEDLTANHYNVDEVLAPLDFPPLEWPEKGKSHETERTGVRRGNWSRMPMVI